MRDRILSGKFGKRRVYYPGMETVRHHPLQIPGNTRRTGQVARGFHRPSLPPRSGEFALPDDLTENGMKQAKPPREWVVYQTPPIGKDGPGIVVAERSDWERL